MKHGKNKSGWGGRQQGAHVPTEQLPLAPSSNATGAVRLNAFDINLRAYSSNFDNVFPIFPIFQANISWINCDIKQSDFLRNNIIIRSINSPKDYVFDVQVWYYSE